jgi:hypothetical protein
MEPGKWLAGFGVVAALAAAPLASPSLLPAVAPTAAQSPVLSTAKGCSPPARFTGVHANNYRVACQVCRLFGPKDIAKDYRIRSSNWATIALGFAQAGYRPAFRRAVFEGCLRGFRLRGKP